ncbi:hypothetical protein JTE90_025303 [Oedothorax gibbosus]|uniref:Uncharacterized protein n=1 Tax=Oedothorax gibbosus TaxID=931172 RepID=A0AAV6V6B4_9ARAC|nr:hypothetical protein JTE90_025303 [Oedothorax gibbosus]
MADVLFLCHAFTSTKPNKNEQVLKNILQLLKPGSLVFLIFNRDYSSKFNELNANGNFLYGPTEITLMTEKVPSYRSQLQVDPDPKLQVDPVNIGSALFGVWQKKEPTTPQKISSSAKLPTTIPTGESQKSVTGTNVNKSTASQNISKIKDSRKLDSLEDSPKNESSNSNVLDSKSSFESLVKTLEGLVTNLEEMVRSHDTVNIGNSQSHHCGFGCPCCKHMHAERSCYSRHQCSSCHHHNHCFCCIRKQANICSITSNCYEHCMSTKHNSCQNYRY